jgi:hypothetical protein
MNYKKNYVLYSALALGVFAAILTLLKIVFSLTYSEATLKKEFTDLMKTAFNRAVQFEEITIDYAGDAVVTSLNLSASSDFNDNMSFIRAPKLIVDLSLIDLLRGTITVRGFTAKNPEIRLLKRYGKNHRESFAPLADLAARAGDLARKTSGAFTVRCKHGTIVYEEIFKDEKVTIIMNEATARIVVDGKSTSYSFRALVPPKLRGAPSTGKFRIEGDIVSGEKPRYRHEIRMQTMDLTHMNRFIEENSPVFFSMKGSLSTRCFITFENGKYRWEGDIEADNLHVASRGRMSNPLLSNENINIAGDIAYDPSTNTWELISGKIHDDNVKLTAKGRYADNDTEHRLEGEFISNTIDLDDLSHFFMPVENIYYGGDLTFSGALDYDIRNNNSEKTRIDLDLKDFRILDITKGAEKTLAQDGRLSLSLKENRMKGLLQGASGKSDYRLSLQSDISSWSPLASQTEATLYSKRMEASHLHAFASALLDSAMASAQIDAQKGYEDLYFLKRPISRYVINNNIIRIQY